MLISKTCSVQEFETREQQVKETEEYVVQERARLNDFESALKLREETLEEQKIELVSFFTSMISRHVLLSLVNLALPVRGRILIWKESLVI